MAELTGHYAQLFSGVNVFDHSLVATIQSKIDRFFEKHRAENPAAICPI